MLALTMVVLKASWRYYGKLKEREKDRDRIEILLV